MKREIKDIKFWEAWMTSHGYSMDFDKYGLWAEDYVEEHRWKDIFEMMMQYASEEKEKIQEQLKIQIYMNEKLLLDLKESTQRIIELENELNHIYDKP